MDLISKPLGAEGQFDLDFVDGKIVIKVSHNHASGSVSIVAEQDASYFLDKLAEKIPGDWDKAVIEVIKGLIKGL